MPSSRILQDIRDLQSRMNKGPQKSSNLRIFIIPGIVLALFALYHGIYIYQDHVLNNQELAKKGQECLYQFKVQNCNPMNLTSECRELATCFQSADNQQQVIGLTMQLIQKTSRSVSQTMVGPIVLIFAVIAINYMRQKK